MLHMYTIAYIFYFFNQNGFYFDFVGKKFVENFIRSVLILNTQFFSEKYLVEFLTKNIFEIFFLTLFKIFHQSNFSQELFFFNLIGSTFVILIFFQLIFFIL